MPAIFSRRARPTSRFARTLTCASSSTTSSSPSRRASSPTSSRPAEKIKAGPAAGAGGRAVTRGNAAVSLEAWELMSYVVTVVGLPLAIIVFLLDRRKERENDEAEVYQELSDNYQDFLKVALDNPDLRLFSAEPTPSLSAEQKERQL